MVTREKKNNMEMLFVLLLYIGLLVIHGFDTHKENLF